MKTSAGSVKLLPLNLLSLADLKIISQVPRFVNSFSDIFLIFLNYLKYVTGLTALPSL